MLRTVFLHAGHPLKPQGPGRSKLYSWRCIHRNFFQVKSVLGFHGGIQLLIFVKSARYHERASASSASNTPDVLVPCYTRKADRVGCGGWGMLCLVTLAVTVAQGVMSSTSKPLDCILRF